MAAVTMQAEKDLTTGIWALSQKLQQVVETTAPVVWESFCKQQVIIGISELATLFVCFFAFLLLLEQCYGGINCLKLSTTMSPR